MEKPIAINLTAGPQPVTTPVSASPAPKPEAPKAMAAPATNTAQPNKNAVVPKSGYVMASDPRVSNALEAFLSSETNKK